MTKEHTNICKGLAILMMYMHHLFYSAKTYEGFEVVFAPFSEDRILWLARGCKICVAIFVLLTGYGYAKSAKMQRQDPQKSDGIKRYFRIMFGFWFIFIIGQITGFLGRDWIAVYGENLSERIIYIIIDVLGLANLFGTPTFNPTWWYLTYAILLVFLTPVIVKLVRKLGGTLIIIAIFLPRVLGIETDTTFMRYFFTLILGVYFAEYNIFEKIYASFKKKRIIEFGIWLLALIITVFLWYRTKWFSIFDGCVAICICYCALRYISHIPILNKCLAFIGVHSMNLFMLHTFIYSYYFKDFIYSFRYWWAILLVLLVSTLFISVLLEQVKRLIKYNELEANCIKKVTNLVNTLEN